MLSFETVKRWLVGIANDKTRTQYVLRIHHYYSETGLNPDQIVKEKAKSLNTAKVI